MAVLNESVRSSLRIGYEGEEAWNFTVSRLNTEADPNSLMLLAEAVGVFQGTEPASLVSTNEYQIIGA